MCRERDWSTLICPPARTSAEWYNVLKTAKVRRDHGGRRARAPRIMNHGPVIRCGPVSFARAENRGNWVRISMFPSALQTSSLVSTISRAVHVENLSYLRGKAVHGEWFLQEVYVSSQNAAVPYRIIGVAGHVEYFDVGQRG